MCVTCREKLIQEHPEHNNGLCFGGCHGCPSQFGYANRPDWCRIGFETCAKCWDREVEDMTVNTSRNTTERSWEMDWIDEAEDKNEKESIIKDSGDRTDTESGKVMDAPKGNGRCDLLPARVLLRLAMYYEVDDPTLKIGSSGQQLLNSAMMHILKYMDCNVDEDHLIAAISDLCMLAWNEENGGIDGCN